MPKWVKDEALWAKAKAEALKTYDESVPKFYAIVTSIYEKMGGKVESRKIEILEVDGVVTCKEHLDLDDSLVECRASGVALPEAKKWEFQKPVDFQWMPGGVNTVDGAGFMGHSITLTVDCRKEDADLIQASFSKHVKASPRRKPFGCVEHHEEEKAFEPVGFSWKDDPEPGIYCTALPTKLGEENVNGRLHTSFSPSFFTDAEYGKAVCLKCEKVLRDDDPCKCDGTPLRFPVGARGHEDTPAHLTRISPKSVGSLTNWNAFENILPVTARSAGDGKMSDDAGHSDQGLGTGTKHTHAPSPANTKGGGTAGRKTTSPAANNNAENPSLMHETAYAASDKANASTHDCHNCSADIPLSDHEQMHRDAAEHHDDAAAKRRQLAATLKGDDKHHHLRMARHHEEQGSYHKDVLNHKHGVAATSKTGTEGVVTATTLDAIYARTQGAVEALALKHKSADQPPTCDSIFERISRKSAGHA